MALTVHTVDTTHHSTKRWNEQKAANPNTRRIQAP